MNTVIAASNSQTGEDSMAVLPPGYKQTEVGVIPKDWKVKRLNELVVFINGKAHENYIKDDGKYIVVNSKFISSEGLVRKYSDYCLVSSEIGSILMVMSDVPKGKAIAKCFVVDKDNYYAINQRICSLKAKTDNPKFLFYLINRNKYYLAFDDGVKQTNLRKDDILGCPLSLPPTKAEQTAITAALSDADALIDSLDKLIAKKRDIKLATMQQLLTGKTRLPGFGGEWKSRRLGEIAEIISGGTPNTIIADNWSGGIKWCTPTDITKTDDKYLYETERTISFKGLSNSSAQLLPPGTLLLCSRATIGDIKIATSEISTNQGFKSLVCKNGINNEFLYYLLCTMKPKMVEKSIGTTFLEISKKEVAALELSLPLPEEQRAIAGVLSGMDAEIAALKRRREKTNAIKQGMMQELLTGRVRLINREVRP